MGSAVCKPSSVLMTIYLRASSPMRSSDTAEADGQPLCLLILHRMGFT